MKKKLAVLLVAALTLGMTACGASKGAGTGNYGRYREKEEKKGT